MKDIYTRVSDQHGITGEHTGAKHEQKQSEP